MYVVMLTTQINNNEINLSVAIIYADSESRTVIRSFEASCLHQLAKSKEGEILNCWNRRKVDGKGG